MITSEDIQECTAEYRFISQTQWNEFIDLCFGNTVNNLSQLNLAQQTVGAQTKTVDIPYNKAGQVNFSVTGLTTNNLKSLSKQGTANVTIDGNTSSVTGRTDSAFDIAVSFPSAGIIRISLVGEAGLTVNWRVKYALLFQ